MVVFVNVIMVLVDRSVDFTSTITSITHGITNFGILVRANGWNYASGFGYTILPRETTGGAFKNNEFTVNETYVQFRCGSDAAFNAGLEIIEYTKSS